MLYNQYKLNAELAIDYGAPLIIKDETGVNKIRF